MIYGLFLSLLISDTAEMKRENQEQNDQNGQNNGNDDYINQNNEPSPKRSRNGAGDEEEIRLLIPSKVIIVYSKIFVCKYSRENVNRLEKPYWKRFLN